MVVDDIRITSSEIGPTLLLAPFVRCYAFRQFNTNGFGLVKPWHAGNEMSMSFFMKEKPVHLMNRETGEILKTGSFTGISGLGTQYNGDMFFKGSYAFFEIYFRPCGFNKIFGIPPDECANLLLDADEIFGTATAFLYEQLCEAKGMNEMRIIADNYLIKKLRKQKQNQPHNSISHTANSILKNSGDINILELAAEANMGIRNFERLFTKQVGVTPKLFSCVTRFNNALSFKLKNPHSDWASIAYECNYYDQMHLIKAFKKFAGNNPSVFLKQTPLTGEHYESRIDS